MGENNNKQRGWNIFFIIISSLALILGIASWIRAGKVPPPTPTNPNPQPLGFGGAFKDILTQAGGWITSFFASQCDPNKIGYTKDGQYKPDKCGYATVNCDPNRTGYELDGTPNPNCGKNYTNCDPDKCDPSRSGWNECGFPDNRCL